MSIPNSYPLSDTLESVDDRTRAAIEGCIATAISFFHEDGEVPPAIIAIPEEGSPKVFPAKHQNDEQKEVVWSFLRVVRITHPVTILVSEVWYLSLEGKNVDTKHLPRPSESPDRKEVVMIQVWDHKRNIMIVAEITRNPTHLGEFYTVRDSDFDEPGAEVTGALNDGPRYQGKDPHERDR